MIEVEALKLALKKEEGSIVLYQRLLAKHPALKDLMYTLITEEQKHRKLINEKITELTRDW
jgi:rubrerythrin